MRQIWNLLLQNPILLFVLGAWLIGMIGNVLKARQQARQRRERSGGQQPSLPSSAERAGLPGSPRQGPMSERQRPSPARSERPVRSPEDIAREMRRILGLEPETPSAPQAPRPPMPAPQQAPRRRPVVADAERPPTPVRATTGERKLELHVDPHVGEQIRDRRMQSIGGGRRKAAQFGSLGGRVAVEKRREVAGSRIRIDDLKRAFVLSEILSPPLGLRPFDERRPES